MSELPVTRDADSPELPRARPAQPWRRICGLDVGPVISVRPGQRLTWGLSGLACGGLLAIAVYLHPSAQGFGTHEELGLPPCGFVLRTGLPCPTCGMTTAFSHFVRGQWVSSFIAQPAGFLLAIAALVVVLVSARIVLTGRIRWIHWNRAGVRGMVACAFVFLFGWGFKLALGLATGQLPMSH